jgi:hypothetical protein
MFALLRGTSFANVEVPLSGCAAIICGSALAMLVAWARAWILSMRLAALLYDGIGMAVVFFLCSVPCVHVFTALVVNMHAMRALDEEGFTAASFEQRYPN